MGLITDMKIFENIRNYMEYSLFDIDIWQIIAATLIILMSIALRKIMVKYVIGFLNKLASKTKTSLDDQIINAIKVPARFITVVLGIYLALRILQLDGETGDFLSHTVRSAIAFSIFWAAYRASSTISIFLTKLTEKTGTEIDNILIHFLQNSLKVLIIVIGIIVIIQEWNYDVAGLLASLGLGGLAFALAAKDTASNLFGGITIMLDKPFAIGDWIKTPNVEGIVEEIGFRSTRVRTFAQALVTIPNTLVTNDPVINWSKRGKRRISFRLGVTYDTTTEQMKECVKQIRYMLENHPKVSSDTIFVYFENFGESALNIFIYLFAETVIWQEFLEIQEDINLKIMGIIEKLGLSIAFPSQSLYIEQPDLSNLVDKKETEKTK